MSGRVKGIAANPEVCRGYALRSVGLATLLRPLIGYHKSAEVAQEAAHTRRSVAELAVEKGLLAAEQVDELLSPENLSPEE